VYCLIQTKRKKKKERQSKYYREVASRFQENSSCPHSDLLSFFDTQLNAQTVEFVNSLTSAVTSRVMQRLAALTECDDQNGILRVRCILESLDHAQAQSVHPQKSPDLVVIEAIAKYIRKNGGEAEIGPIGGKFKAELFSS